MKIRSTVAASVFVLGAVTFWVSQGLRVPNDVFWHLAIGRHLAEVGFPTHDPFAFSTEAIPWSPPEWLGELVMFHVHELSGFVGLACLSLALVLALASVLLLRARAALAHAGGELGWLALPVALALFFPLTIHAPMRPLLAGHLMSAMVLGALELRSRNGRAGPFRALPLLFALWGNLHPSWPLGLIWVGIHLIAQVLERAGLDQRLGLLRRPQQSLAETVLVLLACAVAPILRPDTLDGFLYPFIHLGELGAQANEIVEWFPLSVTDPSQLFALVVLVLSALAMARYRSRVSLFEVFVLVVTGYLAVRHQRFLPVITVALTPLMISLCPEAKSTMSPVVARTLTAMGIALLALSIPTPGPLSANIASTLPVAAVAHVRSHGLPERAFNSFEDGGYLMFELPERQVYIDSRFDLFARAGIFREYMTLRRGERVLEVMDARRIDAAILPTPARDENFVRMTETLRAAGWTEAFADEAAVILVRSPAR